MSSVACALTTDKNGELIAGGYFLKAGSEMSDFFGRLGCERLCHADCDHSGTLDVEDFICFQTKFQTGCQ